ncbi:MAG TPA: aminotransferase class V-fold PLP-dependent enzyme [Pirellulales bacterium]|nr:aminotransferase class V-fold PLP-dependent enzyme [Pirellulales bacterium]
MQGRIYLDQAATSWPKPECVYEAVDQYQRLLGAAAGRGGYAEAVEVSQRVHAARAAVARLLGAERPENVVFAFNGTDALNTAIHGGLAGGGHVITTVAEHNSVLRPLRALERDGRIEVTRLAVAGEGVVEPDEVRRALRSDTALIAVTHASNVTGAIQPAAEIGAIAREAGVLFLLDAAQTAGELPINVRQLQVDMLAAPGHKGLLGPLGTGVLYIRPGVELRVDSLRQGGTGSFSEDDEQPAVLPDKYEAGNLNVPGILGLRAGVEWIIDKGLESLRTESMALSQRLLDRLRETEGITVYGPTPARDRIGLVSFTSGPIDSHEFAAILDSAYRVQGRAGLHCAPLVHKAIGTFALGGTLRLSWGPFNTLAEIDHAADAIGEVSLQAVKTG